MLIVDDFSLHDFHCKIVRDDLFPFPGGGNKARKAIEYEAELRKLGNNALVTTGSIQSNHCRAMAILAAKNNWKCHLVYQGTRSRFEEEKGNALLVRKTKATIEFVEPENTSTSMDNAMKRFKEEGLNPYYVTGGGHDLPGGMAYVKAIQELKTYSELNNWKPDVLFLPSGTGSTQAGIIVGLQQVGWHDVKVIGVSVARKKEKGVLVIHEFIKKLETSLKRTDDLMGKIYFDDDYLCGGYEKTTPNLEQWVEYVINQTGIFFDTTYSGKALWGMSNILNSGEHYKNILFWHTGGLMNMLK